MFSQRNVKAGDVLQFPSNCLHQAPTLKPNTKRWLVFWFAAETKEDLPDLDEVMNATGLFFIFLAFFFNCLLKTLFFFSVCFQERFEVGGPRQWFSLALSSVFNHGPHVQMGFTNLEEFLKKIQNSLDQWIETRLK